MIGSFHQGGSEHQAVALTRLLHEEGSFKVFAATLNYDGVLRDEIESIGLPKIEEFPLTSFYNVNFVRQVRRFARYLRENKIDLIHTHDFYTNILGMAAANLARVPARIASKRETGGMRTTSQEIVEKIALRVTDAIIVNSEAVREHLVQRSFSEDKITLIYNGIDVSRFDSLTLPPETFATFGLPEEESCRYVVMVANLRHVVKNVPMLLRAAQAVLKTDPNVHFVIAGEGELQNSLKNSAKDLGVSDNIHFVGRCGDVPRLLSLADICVLTSTAEGFSNSILEYMAAGKPVVATNVGGAAEAINHGETGYLVGSNDDAAMAVRLIELLANREPAAKMGQSGKELVYERFSNKALLTKTIDLYKSQLN